ncbi:MAG: flagellar motor switch protein FliM [Deltaproteobacteria bacterium]|nr:MAG: flagellar motor switch protein FliM [Deltaproteobacteria bacterium]
MSNILSQEEVDSLLAGVTTGEVKTETDTPVPTDSAVRYDLTRQDQIIQGRMPTLDIINSRFSSLFRVSLSAMVRKDVDVQVRPVDMIKFEEFQHSLPVPTSMHIFRMEPLIGQALLVFDSQLIFSLIECYFGGKGRQKVKVEGRDFTQIETTMIQKLAGVCLADLAAAWKPVHNVKTSYVRSEVNPQFASIVLATDVVMVARFDVEMNGIGGLITVCIPYSSVEPIRHKLQGDFQGDQLPADTNWRRRLYEQIRQISVDITVELGSARITAERLFGLKRGDVIQLESDVDSYLVASVQGVPKFKGQPGLMKGNRALKVAKRLLGPKV